MTSYTITDRDARYETTPSTGLLTGVTLTEGRLTNHAQHGRIVDFPFAANSTALAALVSQGKVKPGQTITLRLATNPDLAAAVDRAWVELAKATETPWSSSRGMDLTQEMDSADSDY